MTMHIEKNFDDDSAEQKDKYSQLKVTINISIGLILRVNVVFYL
jgi:hypothetical protein